MELLLAEFEDRLELEGIFRAARGCRADLDCPPSAALPELIERLVRQRWPDIAEVVERELVR